MTEATQIQTAGTVLCVYYKVPVTQHADMALRVRAFHAELLLACPGLRCELLQRPGSSDGIETWMETYRCATGLTLDMINATEQGAAMAGLPTPRHSERFIPLAP